MSLQLQVIGVFVGAADAPRFMAEFLEIGGVLTVLEILGLKQVSEVGLVAIQVGIFWQLVADRILHLD